MLGKRFFLAMGYADWQSVVRGWADEKKDFVYGSTQQNGVVGHYTQVESHRSSDRSIYVFNVDGQRYGSASRLWSGDLS